MSVEPLLLMGRAIRHLMMPTVALQKQLYMVVWDKGTHIETRVVDALRLPSVIARLEDMHKPFVIYKLSPAAIAVKRKGGTLRYTVYMPSINTALGINTTEGL